MVQIREWIELAAQGIEALAVAIMVSFIIIGTTRWVLHSLKELVGGKIVGGYERYRIVLGKTLLIGLELLVAADIIRTVALDLTLMNIALLGGIVVVRTFLGWTLTVETEGRWPWQIKQKDSQCPIEGMETNAAQGTGTAALVDGTRAKTKGGQ
jgi:uncharacterized membrane protein